MKKILFLILGCSALLAEAITLDTKFIDRAGTNSSLYEHPELAQAGGLEPHWHQEVNITVHIDVCKLLGAEQLQQGARYRIDSVSWIGHPEGWFVGGNRSVRIANGREYVTQSGLNKQKDGNPGVILSADGEGLSFTAEDRLELTIRWRDRNPGGIYMRYFNAPDGCIISGTAMNLNDKGELAGGTPQENYYNKKWRYNSPAIRIKATRLPEEDTATRNKHLYIAAEALAFAILLFLYLNARRKSAHSSKTAQE